MTNSSICCHKININIIHGLSAGRATTLPTTFVVGSVGQYEPSYINHLLLREESEGVHRLSNSTPCIAIEVDQFTMVQAHVSNLSPRLVYVAPKTCVPAGDRWLAATIWQLYVVSRD